MDEFLIKSPDGSGELLFYNRTPFDPNEPINSYWVRITDLNLSATGEIYAGYQSHPVKLFADMALQWSGWPGEMTWRSLEGELALHCSHSKCGHISIRAEFLSGWEDSDWRVEATTMAEAGQLEAIALRAATFFGKECILE